MRGGRVDRDRVARVDTGALDVLHDAGDQDVVPVADGVDLDLTAGEVFVDEDRAGLLLAQDDLHVLLDVLGPRRR